MGIEMNKKGGISRVLAGVGLHAEGVHPSFFFIQMALVKKEKSWQRHSFISQMIGNIVPTVNTAFITSEHVQNITTKLSICHLHISGRNICSEVKNKK